MTTPFDEAISGPPGRRASDPVAIFLVILLGIVAGLTAMAMAWSKRKAVSAVQTSKLIEEDILEEQENLKLAENEQERKVAEGHIEILRADFLEHQDRVSVLAAKHAELKEKLAGVSTWADLTVLPPK